MFHQTFSTHLPELAGEIRLSHIRRFAVRALSVSLAALMLRVLDVAAF